MSVVELSESERQRRETGADWPLNGSTMAGLRRLECLRDCVGQLLGDDVPGDLIETGVWRGGAAVFMKALLEVHGDAERRVWLADSFQGLPAPRPDEYPADGGDEPYSRLHEYDFLSVSEPEVRKTFERFSLLDERVRFVPGWFSETLPQLAGHRWSLIRLDGDMYESTMVALQSLYPGLSPGGFAIIDDYGAIPQCAAAVDEYRAAHGIEDEIHVIDWAGVYWRRSA